MQPPKSDEPELEVYRLNGDQFVDDGGQRLEDCHAVLASLHDYWASRRHGSAFPARSDIDPIDIPTLLEHLLLIEVLDQPLDFRYRLVGGHIVHHAGRNVQGNTVLGLMETGGSQERALQAKAMFLGKLVLDLKEPVFARMRYHSVVTDARNLLQAILLPLGEAGRSVQMVLGGLYYTR